MSHPKQGQTVLLANLQSLASQNPIEVIHHFGDPWHDWQGCEHDALFLARTILKNELVFDFDNPEWTELASEARKLIAYLRSEKIPCYIALTGGKGMHVHVFVDPTSVQIDEGLGQQLKEHGVDVLSITRVLLANNLLEKAGVDAAKAGLDRGKIGWRSSGRGSLIRMCGAVHERGGGVKTIVMEVPDQRPEPASLPLVFPKSLEMWRVGRKLEKAVEDRLKSEVKADKKESVDFHSVKELDKIPCYAKLMSGVEEGKREYGAFTVGLWNHCHGVPIEKALKDVANFSRNCENYTPALEEEHVRACQDAYSGAYRGVSCHRLREIFGNEMCDEELCPLKVIGNQVQKLLKLADLAGIELFTDQQGVPHAAFTVKGHREIWPLDSKRFTDWLASLMWHQFKIAPKEETVKSVLSVMRAEAQNNGVVHPLEVRVAWHDGAIYYDMSDPAWRAVKITAESWSIVNDPPILFRRFPHMAPQVEPKRGGKLSDFFTLVRVPDKQNMPLYGAMMVTSLVPDIAHPIWYLCGPPGSTKSEWVRLERDLLDPSAMSLSSMPRSRDELIQFLDHNYIASLDNISYISADVADLLCKGCTGESFSKRKLYTDKDDVIFRYKRCIRITSVYMVATAPDLLERTIITRMKMVPDCERRTVDDIQRDFEVMRPYVLGAIFDALSGAMSLRSEVKLDTLPRLADFCLWGEAVARALGYEPWEFVNAYRRSLDTQNNQALDANPVGAAIVALMSEGRHTDPEFIGTHTDLLKELERVANDYDLDTRGLPSAPNALSNKLSLLTQNLIRAGIEVEVHPANKVEGEYKQRYGIKPSSATMHVVILRRKKMALTNIEGPWEEKNIVNTVNVDSDRKLDEIVKKRSNDVNDELAISGG